MPRLVKRSLEQRSSVMSRKGGKRETGNVTDNEPRNLYPLSLSSTVSDHITIEDVVTLGNALFYNLQPDGMADQADYALINKILPVFQSLVVNASGPAYSGTLPAHLGAFHGIATSGDGSCFYHAISIQLEGSEELTKGLRAITAHHMSINAEFINQLPVRCETTPSDVLLTTNYAEILEVVINAYQLKRNINIFTHIVGEAQISVAPFRRSVRDLNLYLVGQHYTALKAIEDISSALPRTMVGLPSCSTFVYSSSRIRVDRRLLTPSPDLEDLSTNIKPTLVAEQVQPVKVTKARESRQITLQNAKKLSKIIVSKRKCKKRMLQSPSRRKEHYKCKKEAAAARQASPTARAEHNQRQREAAVAHRASPTARAEHNECQKRGAAARRASPTKRAKLNECQKKVAAVRLGSQTAQAKHRSRKKHLENLRSAQTKLITDPADRILHISRVLASKQRAENAKKIEYRKKLYAAFIYEKKQGSSHPCHSCHRLWFKSSIKTKKVTSFDLTALKAACGDVKDDSVDLCSTCNNSVRLRKVPTLSTQNLQFCFPIILKEIAELTELEERFVSPRIPFMQIRASVSDQQYLVKGRAINIPIQVPSAVSMLPRAASDANVVAICFKRKRAFKTNVLFDYVRPAVIKNAVMHLENSPVYQHFNITLNMQQLSDNDYQLMSNTGPDQLQDEEADESDDDVEEPVNIEDEQTLLHNALVFAPGEGKKPESLFADYVEAQCFLKIYGGELIGQPKGISYQQWIKSEIMRDDRRCACVTKLFFSALKLRVSKMSSSISFCLRKAKSRSSRFTANQLLDQNSVNDIEKHDSGFRVFASDRGAPAYWEKKKKELFAQMRQLGPPTIFLTLSPAETRWPELMIILKQVVDNEKITLEQVEQLQYKDRVRLIQKDPVTVARYFDYRMRKLFNLLKKDGSVFREHKPTDFYVRIEFQSRGSPHAHCLWWLKDAPVYREGTDNKEVIEFIDRFITCSSDLPSDVLELQTHKHTFTCRKGLKSTNKKCRFDIPFFPVNETLILTPFADEEKSKDEVKRMKQVRNNIQNELLQLHKNHDVKTLEEILLQFRLTYVEYIAVIRSGLKRVTVFLKRRPIDCMINSYNTELLLLHGANMDIQFITDIYACATYILNYLNKPNNQMSKLLREANAEIRQGNHSMQEQLKMLGNSFLNASEFSAQEAVYYIMGMSLSTCSRQCEFINTSSPENRVAVVKKKTDLQKLPANSTDIFTKNVFDHYVQRPIALGNTCLADFVALYNYSTKSSKSPRTQNDDEDDDYSVSDNYEEDECYQLLDKSGYLRRRSKAKIIRFVNYSEHDDDYLRENVTLFYPWRNEQEMFGSAGEIYQSNMDQIKENRSKYVFNESILDLLNEAQDKQMNRSESDDDDETRTPEHLRVFDAADSQIRNQHDADVDRMAGGNRAPADEAQPDPVVIPIPKMLPENEYFELVSTLNYAQHRFLLHVLHLFKENKVPFHYCVLGGAGVGKSRLINALQQTILRWLNRTAQLDTLKVLLCAPTGKAAFGIKGTTLHAAFALPLNQCAAELKPLSSSSRTSLFSKFQDIGLIIVDEISMVGTKTFHQVDCRLKQIFNTTESFAGKSVILFGDFNQLPPVCDRYVFESSSNSLYGALIGNPLWELFFSFSLTEIMRQRDDKEFAMALNALAQGTLSQDQINLFKSRICKQDIIPDGAIRLYKTNASVDSVNRDVINRDPQKITVTAVDKVTGQPSAKVAENLLKAAKKATIKDTQIPYFLELSINIKYMVTINVNVEDGLVNGAIGILKEIQDNRLWLLFPSEVGKRRRQDLRHPTNADLTAIDRVVRSIKPWKSQHSVVRKQFPLVPAEAITIYKSQGGTYDQVAVSLLRLKRTELYVALSRCTKLSGLYLIGNFKAPPSPSMNDKVVMEMKRLQNKPVKMSCMFPSMLSNETSIVYLDITSLKKAECWAYLQNFMRLQQPSIFIVAETWTVARDDLNINNYHILLRLDCSTTQKAYGLVVYIRQDIKSSNYLMLLS